MHAQLLRIVVKAVLKEIAIKSIEWGVNEVKMSRLEKANERLKLVNTIKKTHGIDRITNMEDYKYDNLVTDVLSIIDSDVEITKYSVKVPIIPHPSDAWLARMAKTSSGLSALLLRLVQNQEFASKINIVMTKNEASVYSYPLGYIATMGRRSTSSSLLKKVALANKQLKENVRMVPVLHDFSETRVKQLINDADQVVSVVNFDGNFSAIGRIESERRVKDQETWLSERSKLKKPKYATSPVLGSEFKQKLAPGIVIGDEQPLLTRAAMYDITLLTDVYLRQMSESI